MCRAFCLSVCLSAPSQEFERNRLVYGLYMYLLHMSQKLATTVYLTNESVLQGAEKIDVVTLSITNLNRK